MSPHALTEHLEGDCLLGNAEAFQARLHDLLGPGRALTLDLSRMGVTDISFVQLIVSASVTAERAGQSLSLSGLSPGLRGAFEKAGVGFDPAAGRITRD